MNIGPVAGEGSDMNGSGSWNSNGNDSNNFSQGKMEYNVLSNGIANIRNHNTSNDGDGKGTHPGDEQSLSDHFAYTAGLERGVGGGIVVNRSLQAANGIYIGGELANIDPGHTLLGRGQYEGTDHALMTGRLAAMNMLGMGCHVYKHIPILHTRDDYR